MIGPREINNSFGGDPGYFREGFLGIQHAIDRAIIMEETNQVQSVQCDGGCDLCDGGCDFCDGGCDLCDIRCDLCDGGCDIGCDLVVIVIWYDDFNDSWFVVVWSTIKCVVMRVIRSLECVMRV